MKRFLNSERERAKIVGDEMNHSTTHRHAKKGACEKNFLYYSNAV